MPGRHAVDPVLSSPDRTGLVAPACSDPPRYDGPVTPTDPVPARRAMPPERPWSQTGREAAVRKRPPGRDLYGPPSAQPVLALDFGLGEPAHPGQGPTAIGDRDRHQDFPRS